MSITYSLAAINARLQGVVTTIGVTGMFRLYGGGVLISTIALANPCGTVSGGVLTFGGTLIDPGATASGTVDTAIITDGVSTVVTGLTVGIPLSGANVIIVNSLNSLAITAGQQIELVSAEIIGS